MAAKQDYICGKQRKPLQGLIKINNSMTSWNLLGRLCNNHICDKV